MDLKALQATLREFAAERDWRPFHTPKNLAMVRKDQDRLQLRGLLLAGAASAPSAAADEGYFEGLRAKTRKAAKAGARR